MIKKIYLYVITLIIGILITAYISMFDGCVVNYGAPDIPERAEVCSIFVDLYKFGSYLPWILLAVFIPVTAVIFYLSGKKKKHSIELIPRNGGTK